MCEDYVSEEECIGVGEVIGIHFAEGAGGCIIVNSKDRCELGVCTWGDHDNNTNTLEKCFKDGDLDGIQDSIYPDVLKDTEPPVTTITQNNEAQVVISMNDTMVEFSVEDNAEGLEPYTVIKYCVTTSPDVCCSDDILEDIAYPGNTKNIRQCLEDYNMDTIDLAQIAIRLNDKYALNFVWEDFDRLNTVQSISEMVEAKLQLPDVPCGGDNGKT